MRIWQVFKRTDLSSHYPTSGTLFLDQMSTRASRNLSERVTCILCSGKADKIMNCVHEGELVKECSERENDERVTETETENNNIEEESLHTILAHPEIESGNENERNATTTSFVSKLPRRMFAYAAE